MTAEARDFISFKTETCARAQVTYLHIEHLPSLGSIGKADVFLEERCIMYPILTEHACCSAPSPSHVSQIRGRMRRARGHAEAGWDASGGDEQEPRRMRAQRPCHGYGRRWGG